MVDDRGRGRGRAAGRTAANGAVLRFLGSRPVEALAGAVNRGRLRVLAFHEVDDADRFAALMRHVRDRYHPVSGAEVAAALSGRAALPPRAVWTTFDDGHPSVVRTALPILERYGMCATMFVCPAMIDSGQPFWWQVVEQAVELGLASDRTNGRLPSVSAMKVMPDHRRRAIVDALTEQVRARTGRPPGGEQLGEAALRTWVRAGHEVGNHSWDHPCLDTCADAEQRRQVVMAHRWLHARGIAAESFAYPNGNWSAEAERTVRELGYRVGVLFDHRLASLGQHPLRLSRVRVSADAPLERFRALVSGAHSAAFPLARLAAARG